MTAPTDHSRTDDRLCAGGGGTHGHRASIAGHRLAIGFAVTALLWAAAYVSLMPGVGAPRGALAVVAAGLLLGGGVVAGRWAGRGLRGGVALGLTVTAINGLILGSLGRGEDVASVLSSALPWVGGFLGLAVVASAAGAAIGRRIAARRGDLEPGAAPRVNWSGWLAIALAGCALMLVKAGGVVTGLDQGMAVPDGLTTFGFPTFLFPMERMQADGGVYVEHFHRLWGLLVGVGAIALTLHQFRHEPRRRARWAAAGILAAVCVQGLLGAARVSEVSLTLAAIHGVLGQIVFASMVAFAAATSLTWRRPDLEPVVRPGERGLAQVAVGMLVVQIGLGAAYRHLQANPDATDGALSGLLHMHIVGAVAAVGLAIAVGGRCWSRTDVPRLVRRTAAALVVLVSWQFVLGFVALIVVPGRFRPAEEAIPFVEVAITTLHQVTGALLLALATALAAWSWRLRTGVAVATDPAAAPSDPAATPAAAPRAT